MNAAEVALVNALTDVEALERLAGLGLAPEVVPTPDLYKIIEWAITYFLNSNREQAPSAEVLIASWGATLDAIGAELQAEDIQTDRVDWAVSHLKSQHAHHAFQTILTDAATAMAGADEPDRADVVAAAANRMSALLEAVTERQASQNGAVGMRESIARLEHRMSSGGLPPGLCFGMPLIDIHTGGIQRGELGIGIAPQKLGKSFWAAWTTLSHFLAGGALALFTLENTRASMFDRLACMAARVDYTDYQRGEIDRKSLDYLKDWVSTHSSDLADRVLVLRPDEAGSTAPAMCRTTRLFGADSIIIDQLSYMELASQVRYRSDREMLARTIRELTRALGDEAAGPLSGLLLHQASREAAELAKKTGTLGQSGGSGTSEVERAPDLFIGMHQSPDDEECDEAVFELLAFRRGPKARWQLTWKPWCGDIRVHPTLGMSGAAR